jgi:hypothetical protein
MQPEMYHTFITVFVFHCRPIAQSNAAMCWSSSAMSSADSVATLCTACLLQVRAVLESMGSVTAYVLQAQA